MHGCVDCPARSASVAGVQPSTGLSYSDGAAIAVRLDIDARHLAECVAGVGETIETVPVEFDDISHDKKSDPFGRRARNVRASRDFDTVFDQLAIDEPAVRILTS